MRNLHQKWKSLSHEGENMCYPHYLSCVILNLPMHNIDAHLGLLHSYYLVAKKTPWSLVGKYAKETEYLLDQSISLNR